MICQQQQYRPAELVYQSSSSSSNSSSSYSKGSCYQLVQPNLPSKIPENEKIYVCNFKSHRDSKGSYLTNDIGGELAASAASMNITSNASVFRSSNKERTQKKTETKILRSHGREFLLDQDHKNDLENTGLFKR